MNSLMGVHSLLFLHEFTKLFSRYQRFAQLVRSKDCFDIVFQTWSENAANKMSPLLQQIGDEMNTCTRLNIRIPELRGPSGNVVTGMSSEKETRMLNNMLVCLLLF